MVFDILVCTFCFDEKKRYLCAAKYLIYMVRTIITPTQTEIHLSIPKKYIGKKVEITFFALDELVKKQSKRTLGDFLGLLSKDDYTQINEYTQQARKEWNRNF